MNCGEEEYTLLPCQSLILSWLFVLLMQHAFLFKAWNH